MASHINDTEPVKRVVPIEGYECNVTMDKDGLHFTRKGDKTRGEKPTITLKWGDALEIGAERMKDADGKLVTDKDGNPLSAYTFLGFDK
jgi:hypothetical protein